MIQALRFLATVQRITLLSWAMAATLPRTRSADGFGMLLHQAVRGYAPRFGRAPAVTPELLALLEAGLGATASVAPR
jgi:shikimate dehydrogenase